MKAAAATLNTKPSILSKSIVAAIVMVALLTIRVCAQDAEYLRIFETIQQADALATAKPSAALEKYRQAYAELSQIRQNDRTYKPDLISYRLNDVAKKIAACNEKLNASAIPAPNTSTATGSVQQTQSAPTKSSQSHPIVKVLEAGDAPQKLLRLQPSPGDTQTMTAVTRFSMKPVITNLPPVTEISQITIKSVSSAGNIDYERLVTNITMPAESGQPSVYYQPLSNAFASMKGTIASGSLSSRGLVLRKETKRSTTSSKQQLPAFLRFIDGSFGMSVDGFVIFPEEPVGLGAKWEITRVGETFSQRILYQVVSMEGNHVTIKEDQIIDEPAQTTRSNGLKAKASGEITMDLARITPTRANLVLEMELSGAASAGKSDAIKMHTEYRIESK